MQTVLTFDPACGVDARKAAFWADALDRQAVEFCAKTGKEYAPVTFYSTDILMALQGDALTQFTTDSYLVTVQISLDVPGALGYHDSQAGVDFARIGWQQDDTSITLSHEILELLGNRTCDGYKPWKGGAQQAEEYCDRVEADSYVETGYVGDDTMPVTVSSYLLQAAFEANSIGPWDRMGRLTSWDGMTQGGYVIVQNPDGSEVNVFAETSQGYANAAKKLARVGGRAYRRLQK